MRAAAAGRRGGSADMRVRKDRSHANQTGTVEGGRRRREGRGLGPFTGGQLTIIIVAICAMFALPTAALAASTAFTSKNTSAAVVANNTSNKAGAVGIYAKQTGVGSGIRFGLRADANGKGGVGIEAAGKKYGVFSNGPLAVTGNATVNGNVLITPKKAFTCTACVTAADLGGDAKKTQPLVPGESQSGVFNAADIYPTTTPGLLQTSLTFTRRVPGTLAYTVILAGGAVTTACPGAGSAAPGNVCVYGTANQDVSTGSGFTISSGGAGLTWIEGGAGSAIARGTFTVTAP
jgi:hypothetical protein